MLTRLRTKPIPARYALAIAVLALFASASRANLDGTLAPATPLRVALQVIALPLCLLILLPRRPLPEWVKRSRLTRLALALLIVGPIVSLGSYLPLATATRGKLALDAADLALLALFLLWASCGIRRSLARAYASWDTRPKPIALRPPITLGPSQLVPPPESSMSTRTWRNLARLQLVAKQRVIGFDRWRMAHHTHPERVQPLVQFKDPQAGHLWHAARATISRWRVPFDPEASPTPVFVAVVRPTSRGTRRSIHDRAATLVLIGLRRLYLPLAPCVAIAIAAPLTGLSPYAGYGPAMLLTVLYFAIVTLSQPAWRTARGDLPLDAQTALRQLRFRGYHPSFHRQLWNALEPDT